MTRLTDDDIELKAYGIEIPSDMSDPWGDGFVVGAKWVRDHYTAPQPSLPSDEEAKRYIIEKGANAGQTLAVLEFLAWLRTKAPGGNNEGS